MNHQTSVAMGRARHALPLIAVAAAAAIALAACTSAGASPSGGASPSAKAAAGTPLEGTAWQLTDYVGPDGKTLPVPEAVGATATFSAGTVAGNAGCNQYHGAYTIDGDKMTVGQVAMTAMACSAPQMALETAYTAALQKTATYAITGETLELRTADGKVGLRYAVATPPSLTKTRWVANQINNGKGGAQGVATGSTVTAIFAEDGTVSGSGGCNNYNGPYTVDGAALDFGPLISTKMACADEAVSLQEANYFAALDRVTKFDFIGDTLELRDADGALQASYQPSAP